MREYFICESELFSEGKICSTRIDTVYHFKGFWLFLSGERPTIYNRSDFQILRLIGKKKNEFLKENGIPDLPVGYEYSVYDESKYKIDGDNSFDDVKEKEHLRIKVAPGIEFDLYSFKNTDSSNEDDDGFLGFIEYNGRQIHITDIYEYDYNSEAYDKKYFRIIESSKSPVSVQWFPWIGTENGIVENISPTDKDLLYHIILSDTNYDANLIFDFKNCNAIFIRKRCIWSIY